MKVFISSVIIGFEEFRDAVQKAVTDLGHEVLRAENFSAQDSSSRVACLSHVREADLIILLLAGRYGTRLPPKDISPTHEEFLEAKNQKPILVFRHDTSEIEPDQENFIEEVEDWDNGRHRTVFANATELNSQVIRALHDFELKSARAPVDVPSLVEEARQVLATGRSSWMISNEGRLNLAVVGGPATQILRPKEMEDSDLDEVISKELLFGENKIFDRRLGVETRRQSGQLIFHQHSGGSFSLSENGTFKVSFPIVQTGSGWPAIIVEDAEDALTTCFALLAHVLDLVDSGSRLARLVIALKTSGTDYVSWQTRAEYAKSGNGAQGVSYGQPGDEPVTMQPPDIARAALRYNRREISEDLISLLKRDAHPQGRGF